MRRAKNIPVFVILLTLLAPVAPTAAQKQRIDRIAARIEDDVILESEVRELAAYQELVEGRAEPREKLLRELIDQWIVRSEAVAARYPHPSQDDVNRQAAQLERPFGSPEAFHAKLAQLGIGEEAVRRIVTQEIYLSRFLDYKFRPAAQIDEQQVEAYYREQFAAQMAAKGQPAPPLETVREQIHELLTQREVNDRAGRWLEETRARLRIDITPGGGS
jgi:hypothetical protein